MAIKNLVSSSYNYSSESYGSGHLNWSLEDEAENKASADMSVIDAESEVDSAEHAANAADAMAGVLEVAEASGGEVTENEASLIDDVNTAVAGGATDPEEAPIVVSSESNGRYYISKEGIVDKIKEIWKRIKEAIMRVWDKLKDAYKKYFGTYKSMQKRAEKIKKRAEDMSGKTIDKKTFEYENNVAILHYGDTKITSATLAIKSLEDCEKFVNYKFISENLKIGDASIDIVNEYDGKNTDGTSMGKLVDKIVDLERKSSMSVGDNEGFIGFKKLVFEDDNKPHAGVKDSWQTTLNNMYSNKLRLNDFSEAKLSPKITFTTMSTGDVEKVCEQVITMAKDFVTISSSTGMDKLMVKKDKLKEASDKLDKRHQSSIKDEDGHTSEHSAEYTLVLKVNTHYASVASVFSRLFQLTGTFMGVCLTLAEKSLDNHKSK